VAKKKTTKSATTKRSKARRPAPKRAKKKSVKRRARKAAAPSRTGLDLKELKSQLEAAVRALPGGPAAAPLAAAVSSDGADIARARFSDFILAIDEICGRGGCGPDMIFP
jgi:hypothetical protein